MEWFPKRVRCPNCGRFAEIVRIVDYMPEYKCRCGEVIKWIEGKKLRRLTLPLKVKYNEYHAVFYRKIPNFWQSALGIYQDNEGNIWYHSNWRVTFIPKTRLFRLYVDGKPVMIEEAKLSK